MLQQTSHIREESKDAHFTEIDISARPMQNIKSLGTIAFKTQQVLNSLPKGVKYNGPKCIYSYKFVLKYTGKNVLLSPSEFRVYRHAIKQLAAQSDAALQKMHSNEQTCHQGGSQRSIGLFTVVLDAIRLRDLRRMRYVLSTADYAKVKMLR